MNRWINRYGIVAVLLMLLFAMNPELRAFLLLANFIGLDLMIFFFMIQLRHLLPAIEHRYQMGSFVCVASYTALRVTTRTIGLLLAPAYRATAGLTTLLFVLSENMWCARQKQDLQGA